MYKFEPKFKKFTISDISGLSLYYYNSELRQAIFLYKGCKDYELKDIFVLPFKNELLLLFKNYILIPAPSFKEKIEERGFNHVIEMFKPLNLPILDVFIKTSNIAQHNLNYTNRQKIGDYIEINKSFDLNNKKILLIDDIVTTGATLKACIKLLKESFQIKKMKILVVAKREFSDEEKEIVRKNHPILDD